MKIGLLFNCQGATIAHAFRALLPSVEVRCLMPTEGSATDTEVRAQMEPLAGCDCVFMLDGATSQSARFVGNLRRRGVQLHKLPAFRFRGFHPDTIYLFRKSGRKILGPTVGYHSRIAVAGFLAGLPPEATAELYNSLSYRRLGYYSEYATQVALLVENFAARDLAFGPILERLIARGCFMHSINHPKAAPLLEVARAACALIGVPIENDDVRPEDLPDELAKAPIHPVFPEIAAQIGIPPEGCFRGAAMDGHSGEVYSIEKFITKSFIALATAEREELLAGDGVAQALQALKLQPSANASAA